MTSKIQNLNTHIQSTGAPASNFAKLNGRIRTVERLDSKDEAAKPAGRNWRGIALKVSLLIAAAIALAALIAFGPSIMTGLKIIFYSLIAGSAAGMHC